MKHRSVRILPDLRGRYRLVAAAAVDTLGVGLFLPLSLYYFTVTTDLPVAAIGAVTSAATLAALLVAPWAGRLTVRRGPRTTSVASNLVSACGYLGYLFVHDLPLLFVAVFVVMAGDRMYFAAWPTLVADVAGRDELDAWYAVFQASGAGCLGLGALISGALLAGSSAAVLKTLLLINALTSVVAAVLTASLKTDAGRRREPERGGADGSRGRYREILRDRHFRRLLAAQMLIATAWTMPGTFLPLYLVRTLHMPLWYAMTCFSLNYFLMFAGQMSVTRLVQGIPRNVIMAAGAGCFFAAAAVIAVASLVDRATGFGVILAGIVLFSLGEMLCVPTGNAMVAAHAPDSIRGMYMAVFQLTGAIAYGVGPGVVGALFALDSRLVLAAVACFVALGALAFYSVGSPNRPRTGFSSSL
jgi:MFS family permease